jgi:V-type H+-transporting ATPase subunit C
MQLWLVTVPNRGESPDATYSALTRQVPSCKLHRFEIPSLVVGTLDSLMALSDDLTKINTQVEVDTFSVLIFRYLTITFQVCCEKN